MSKWNLKSLEKVFPWLPLMCDGCHTNLVADYGNANRQNPLDIMCGVCEAKFNSWCDRKEIEVANTPDSESFL